MEDSKCAPNYVINYRNLATKLVEMMGIIFELCQNPLGYQRDWCELLEPPRLY